MTLFLQYNVNTHILDGVRYLWWPSVFSCGESVSVLSKDLLNLETPYVTLAMHLVHTPFYINTQELKTFYNYTIIIKNTIFP